MRCFGLFHSYAQLKPKKARVGSKGSEWVKKAQSGAVGAKRGENGEKVGEMVQNAFKVGLWGRKRAKMERLR